MVGTIAPVVYGQRIGAVGHVAWLPGVSMHLLGLVGGGLAMGGLVGGVGQLLPFAPLDAKTSATALLLLAAPYAYHELGLFSLPYPQWKRQVQSDWRYRMHPAITLLLYGLQLGTGYMTFVLVATLHVLTAAIALKGWVVPGLMLFVVFAAVRGIGTAFLVSRVQSPEDGARIASLMIETLPVVHLINGWLLALTSGCLLYIAFR